MNPETYNLLIALNRNFYAGFADAFARTRRHWPAGFMHILPHLRPAANVLDLGCGNGRLLAFLAEHGWRGAYLGVDGSAGLLAEAAQAAANHPSAAARFVEADLSEATWVERVRPTGGAWGQPAAGWEAAACLAVLHHMPGAANRARFLGQCKSILAQGGRLIVSTWQFMTSERLRGRVLPWETVGLDASAVEPEDYLVAWGAGAAGQRYCAFINHESLAATAEEAGLAVGPIYYADGQEGNLNLYAVLTAR